MTQLTLRQREILVELSQRDRELLRVIASSDLNLARAGRELGIDRRTVLTKVLRIHAATSEDPRSFYGLANLLAVIRLGDQALKEMKER